MVNKPLFINTRPIHRSHELNQLGDGCVQMVNLPLLAINDLSPNAQEQAMLDALMNGVYQALVVTSAEAAKRAISHLRTLGHQHADDLPKLIATPTIAVGKATAKALYDFGLSVALPTIANNEGMLAMPVIDKLQAGDKILIWRGVGGRRLLHDTLAGRGVQVDAMAWYERVAPHDLAQNYHAIAPQLAYANTHNIPIFMLIASQMAFEHWQNLDSPFANNIHYLTLGVRLFDIVKSASPTTCVHLIDELSSNHLKKVIADIHKSVLSS
ncbi:MULTISPECIES: uroporphyrinogen-III synthase [unclassified Moraxella]|uniref:uroporphyrinogen-III synthase n=1 Tax=unclassified Moraxella TaxID=2685852 RepID=UPI00359F053F